MSITAQNASYITNGPTVSGQVMQASALTQVELAYIGTATFTLDGSATSATLNYIDGTATLPFTPTAIIASRSGGNATATVSVVSAVDAANNNKTATVQFSAAGGNNTTLTVAFAILK